MIPPPPRSTLFPYTTLFRSNVPPDQMKIVKTLAVTSSRFAVLSMNTTQAPLSDKRVRQALHYALDLPSIVKNLYAGQDRKSTRLNSSHANISYAVFCLKKKT